MNWIGFFHDSFFGVISMLKQMALIVFPLFIGVEIIDYYGVLEKVSGLFQGVLQYFQLPREASLPFIVSQSFGLLYGAGLIIRATEEDNLNSGELFSISIFFSLCHAVFEDTLIFAAMGGSGLIILSLRVFLAASITYFYGLYRKKSTYKSSFNSAK